MSDKDFKVKNKLQVKGITSAGPVVSDASGNLDSTAYIATQYGGTGTSTSPNSGQILYSASGTNYAPTTLSGLDVKGATYSADAPASPFVGQVWIESDSSSDSFDPNIMRRKSFTATASQTVFTTDYVFIDGYEQVYFNGMLLLRNTDYTTSGASSTVTLSSGAAAGDIIEVVTITNLNSINTATTTTNTFTGTQTISNTSASSIPLTIQAASSQSAKLLDIKNSSGSSIAYFNPSGSLTNTGLNLSSYGQVVCQTSDTGISISGGTGYPNGGTIVFRGNNGGAGGTAANGLEFVAGGLERMRIDSSGNIGIGTTTSLSKFTVLGSSSTVANSVSTRSPIASIRGGNDNNRLELYIDNSGGTAIMGIGAYNTSGGATSLSFYTGASVDERMRIDTNGNITLNSGKGMYFQNPINTGAGSIFCPGGGSLSLASYNQTMLLLNEDNSILFKVGNGTDRARFDSNGYLLIGYTSSNGSYRLQVNSQIFATSSSIATSDGRYKENVETISGGLGIIDSLRPVSFDWKKHPVHNFVEGKTVGFIAQEVKEALADYDWINNIIKTNVTEAILDEEGNEIAPSEEFLGIAESNIIPLLVAAVKELKARIEVLENV